MFTCIYVFISVFIYLYFVNLHLQKYMLHVGREPSYIPVAVASPWLGLRGQAFESPPEACSLRFNEQGQVVEYTAGAPATLWGLPQRHGGF